MALMTRMARLLRADLNAVLDRIEEPAILLREALREMEHSVAADRRRHAWLGTQRDAMAARIGDLERSLEGVGAQLDACLDAGNDELARAMLQRQLGSQRELRSCARQRAQLAAQRDALALRLGDHEARLQAMREQSEALDAQSTRHEYEATPQHIEPAVSEQDVDVALLRAKQARAGA